MFTFIDLSKLKEHQRDGRWSLYLNSSSSKGGVDCGSGESLGIYEEVLSSNSIVIANNNNK